MKTKTKVIITADTNDADYVTSEYEVNGQEALDFIKKVASVIKITKAQYNWSTSEYGYGNPSPGSLYSSLLTQHEIEKFNDLVPYGEYGIHSIVSIRIVKIVEDKELLK